MRRHVETKPKQIYSIEILRNSLKSLRILPVLKKGAGGAEISSVCRQIALEAGRHGKTIGKDLIAVEMDRTGHTHCSHYSEDGAEVILVPDIP